MHSMLVSLLSCVALLVFLLIAPFIVLITQYVEYGNMIQLKCDIRNQTFYPRYGIITYCYDDRCGDSRMCETHNNNINVVKSCIETTYEIGRILECFSYTKKPYLVSLDRYIPYEISGIIIISILSVLVMVVVCVPFIYYCVRNFNLREIPREERYNSNIYSRLPRRRSSVE